MFLSVPRPHCSITKYTYKVRQLKRISRVYSLFTIHSALREYTDPTALCRGNQVLFLLVQGVGKKAALVDDLLKFKLRLCPLRFQARGQLSWDLGRSQWSDGEKGRLAGAELKVSFLLNRCTKDFSGVVVWVKLQHRETYGAGLRTVQLKISIFVIVGWKPDCMFQGHFAI